MLTCCLSCHSLLPDNIIHLISLLSFMELMFSDVKTEIQKLLGHVLVVSVLGLVYVYDLVGSRWVQSLVG